MDIAYQLITFVTYSCWQTKRSIREMFEEQREGEKTIQSADRNNSLAFAHSHTFQCLAIVVCSTGNFHKKRKEKIVIPSVSLRIIYGHWLDTSRSWNEKNMLITICHIVSEALETLSRQRKLRDMSAVFLVGSCVKRDRFKSLFSLSLRRDVNLRGISSWVASRKTKD